MTKRIRIIGAGLAGCEAAWQCAERGIEVELVEMKPLRRTEAQSSDRLGELVCSNSLRSRNPLNPIGLIKDEMHRMGSLIIDAAEANAVPAGDALAVDREGFSAFIEAALERHPKIERRAEVVEKLPDDLPTIVSTGPLTATELAQDIGKYTKTERLYFYDSIAPIIAGDSINRDIVFAESRYGKGDGDDYLNCPMNKEEYEGFVKALLAAEYMPLHDFEKPKYFQGCLPIEVVAATGIDTLRHGAMKPVGLTDPRTGQEPYAVVQLRREDIHGQAFNLVGFQTKMKYPEQKKVFSMIPGLENAEFLRLGAIHRNTYLDSPAVLDSQMRLLELPNVRFAGQITGVEGYVESAAHGLIVGWMLSKELNGETFELPPIGTALGALINHVTGGTRIEGRPHEPQNINWAMFEPIKTKGSKSMRKLQRVVHALETFTNWAAATKEPVRASRVDLEKLETEVKSRKPRRRQKRNDNPQPTS